MWGGRAPWLVLATLMSAAAAAFGAGTYRYWLPCRDQLLNGSVLAGYQLSGDFPAGCLARMDAGGPLPLAGAAGQGEPGSQSLVAVALLILAVAWAGFMAAQRWTVPARAVAALPGALTGVLGVATLAASRGTPVQNSWMQWLPVAIDLAALLAAGVIVQHTDGLNRLGQLVGLWGIASFGWIRALCDYAVMLGLSAANWDVPPGSGFPTALTIAVCGLVAAGLGMTRQRVRPDSRRLPALATPQTS